MNLFCSKVVTTTILLKEFLLKWHNCALELNSVIIHICNIIFC